jgi:hypothetical protein
LLFCFGGLHVLLDGAWPDCGSLVIVAEVPAFIHATVVGIDVESPFTIEQLKEVVSRYGTRERILYWWRELRSIFDYARRAEVGC